MARPFFVKVDWTVVTCIFLLAGVSLLTLYSATAASGGGELNRVFRQATWFAVGFLLIILMISIDYHILSVLAYPLYVAVVAALAAVLAVGEVIQGSQRWIKVGPISIQPSEMAKIALILVLARYFSNRKKDGVYLFDVIFAGMLLGIPLVLILKEPDLGSSILLLPIFVAIVFVAGLDLRPLLRIFTFRPLLMPLVLLLALATLYFVKIQFKQYWRVTDKTLTSLEQQGVATDLLDKLANLKEKEYTEEKKFCTEVEKKIGKEPLTAYKAVILESSRPKVRLLAVPFKVVWLNMKEYQRNRVLTFIDPDSDPLGSGYHIRQSQIAIGSAGFWGKGYMKGKQSQLKFLPEQFTDFIFSAFSEEWGFAGSAAVLAIYLTLILKGLTIAAKAKDQLGRFIAIGVVTILVVQTFVNVGVTTGVMPVTGLTLPLVSYGGSSIFSTSMSLGLLLNVSYHRFDF